MDPETLTLLLGDQLSLIESHQIKKRPKKLRDLSLNFSKDAVQKFESVIC